MRKLFASMALVLVFFATTVLAAVNINTATPKQLMQLDGVGKVKAQAIVKYRHDHGKFKTTKEITKVDGIGKKTYAGIKDEITVKGESTKSGK